MLVCPVALRSGAGVVADRGPIYVSVRGDEKAVDQRFSWIASLPPVLVDRIFTATSPSRSSETTWKTSSPNLHDLFRSGERIRYQW